MKEEEKLTNSESTVTATEHTINTVTEPATEQMTEEATAAEKEEVTEAETEENAEQVREDTFGQDEEQETEDTAVEADEDLSGTVKGLADLDLLLDEDRAEEEEYQRRREQRRRAAEASRNEPTLMQEILSWVIPIGLAVVISLCLKSFVIISARVPSASMENTIMTKDNLFGYRLAYRKEDPQRGDIVIFYFPDNEEKKYIKRIIGLPGETVVIDEGRIYIDGSEDPLYEDYLKEEWVSGTGYYEFHVPEDSYLMLGDNRNISEDARYWQNPYVARNKIIAKAVFIYYPFSHLGRIEGEIYY